MTMKKLLTIFCLVLLSSYSYSEEVSEDQLVEREGVYYKKFSPTPFTGTLVEFYETGQLEGRENLKNGLLQGDFVVFYENGQLEERGNYKDGERDGLWEEYEENGQLLMKGNYTDGEREGPWEVYHDGSVVFNFCYKNGEDINESNCEK